MIELRSNMSITDLAGKLGRCGVLRTAKDMNFEKDGVQFVYLRERTILEAVQDFFTFNSKTLTKPALDAHKAIESVLGNKVNSSQLLQNIQDRIELKGNFSGRSIARDAIKDRREKRKILPLDGGTAVAEPIGFGVHVLHAKPLQVKSNFSIVPILTLPNKLVKTDTGTNTFQGFTLSNPEGIAPANLAVLEAPPLIEDKDADSYESTFKKRLRSALVAASEVGGAIVIEVSPEMFATGQENVTKKKQEKLISTMINVVNHTLEKAKNENKQMSVTFAGEDKKWLSYFISRYESGRSELQKVKKQESSDPPALIDPDHDNDDYELPDLEKDFVATTLEPYDEAKKSNK